MKRTFIALAALGSMAAAVAGAADAGKGRRLFENNGCVGCHEIGKDKNGPDLKNVTARRSREWIISFIQNPEKYHEDPQIKEYVAKYKIKMPNQGVERAEAEAIFEYLKSLPAS